MASSSSFRPMADLHHASSAQSLPPEARGRSSVALRGAGIFAVARGVWQEQTWLQTLPALVLVFYPLNALLPVGVQLRTLDDLIARSRGRRGAWFAWCVPIWLIDPLRAFAGVWLLKRVMVGTAESWPIAFTFALAAGLVVQLWTQREPHVAWAPLGFCAGVVLALAPWIPALAVILTGLLGLVLLRSWTGYFLGLVAAIVTLGCVLPTTEVPWFTLAGLMAVPAALPVLIDCRLVAPAQ